MALLKTVKLPLPNCPLKFVAYSRTLCIWSRNTSDIFPEVWSIIPAILPIFLFMVLCGNIVFTKLASRLSNLGAASTNCSAFIEESKISFFPTLTPSRSLALVVIILSITPGINDTRGDIIPLSSCLNSLLVMSAPLPNNCFSASLTLGSNASFCISSIKVPNSFDSAPFNPNASCMYCLPLSLALLYAYKL